MWRMEGHRSGSLPGVVRVARVARVALLRAWVLFWTLGGRTGKVGVLQARGDYVGASLLLTRLLRKRPDDLGLLLGMAFCQRRLGNKEAHLALLQHAYRLDDRRLDVAFALCQSLIDMRRSAEALPHLALIKDIPEFAAAVDQIAGAVVMGRGEAGRAKDFFLASWMCNFEQPYAGMGYLFPLAYAETDEAWLAQEHQFWADTLPARPLPDASQLQAADSRALEALRRLPQPAAGNHDKSRFEVLIYSQNDPEMPYDTQTQAFRNAADYFYDVGTLSDSALELFMLEHRLDVLVELSGHTAGNRLPMLSRRLAAVQLTGLAYPPTTGLRSVDAKFMDPHIHVPQASAYYAENPLVLPHALWCFDPMSEVPEAGPPPMLKNGYVTFACMGNLAKVTPEILQCWARILKALPTARLLIQSPSFGDPDIVQAFEARLQAAHINPAHITLSPAQPTEDFWTRYREIDLILDTYPFNGGTTSCYSAYAGVPLLTLSGQSLISRVGRSIVCNLGFASLAVDSYEQYVQRALELVNDGALLAAFRREARERLRNSSMGNGRRFAAEFETAALDLLQRARAGEMVNASTVAPLPHEVLLQRAELVWYHGHRAASRRILELCLRHYPGCAAAHVLRARQMVRMGELLPARSLLIEQLPQLAPTDAADAHLLLANIALNLGTPAPAQTAVGALKAMNAQGHLSPAQVRYLGLLSAACQLASGSTALPLAPTAKRRTGAAVTVRQTQQPDGLRVLVLVPCHRETELQDLEHHTRRTCVHPVGWDISYRSCDARDRIAGYNDALSRSTHDMVLLLQPQLRLYQPALFTELAEALQHADVVGCAGARRWVQKDWTLDLPAFKAWGLMRPSPVRAGMVDVHVVGDMEGYLVSGAAVLDGKLLALRPAAVRGIGLDEDLYDTQSLAEEDWTNRLHAAGRRLVVHRNLGVMLPQATDRANPQVTQGQRRLLERLKLDPLAVTIRNYESISAPLADAQLAQRAMDRYFGSQTHTEGKPH